MPSRAGVAHDAPFTPGGVAGPTVTGMLFLVVCLKDPRPRRLPAYEAVLRRIWAAHDGTAWRRVCRVADRLALFAAASRDRPTVGAVLEDEGDRVVLAPYAAVLPEGTRPERAAAAALPPFLRLEADLAAGSLRVANDWLGLSRAFYLDEPDTLVVSNRLDLLRRAACRHLPLDEGALACFAATGWLMEDTTPLAGVSTLPPNSSLSFEPEPGRRCELTLSRRPMPLVTPGEREATPALLESAAAGLTTTATRIGALTGGPVDLAFSGGQDLRLLAAAFIAAGVELRLHTWAAYEAEAAIAAELVRRLGPGRAEHLVYPGDPPSEVPVDPLASARYLVAYSGGLYDPVYVGEAEVGSLDGPGLGGKPIVHGGLGEIAHGFYYPKGSTPEEERDDDAMARRLLARAIPRKPLTAPALAAAERAFARVVAAGKGLGFAGIRLCDWFWLVERYRRMNPVTAYFDHLLPFADLGFVNTALSLAPSEHRARRLHRGLTTTLVPEWRDVPYFKAADDSGPERRARHLVVDPATVSLLTGEAYLRRFYRRDRLEKAVRAVAGGRRHRAEEGRIVKRALWLLALRAEFGDGSDGPATGHRWLAALLAVLRRASGRQGWPP